MAAPPRRKIRVLCLHGFRTNAKVIETQTQVVQKALGSEAEFVFLDGPFEAVGSSAPVIERMFSEHTPFREWFRIPSTGKVSAGAGKDTEMNSAEVVAKVRGTMDPHNEWYLGYEGIETTIALIDEKISTLGPFDVVIGFSQGAIVLTILSALYLQKHSVRLWKLVICVGGLRVMDPQFRSLFENPGTGESIPVPFSSVHIIGKKDPIYHESHKLVKMYEDYPDTSSSATRTKIVYEHSGGHRFPSLEGNEAFYEELVSVIHDHCNAEFNQSDESRVSKL